MLLLSSCSQSVPDILTVQCHDDAGCPTADEVGAALALESDVFSEAGISMDPAPALTVEWYPRGHSFGETINEFGAEMRITGQTLAVDRIAVTGWPILLHERVHAHFWAASANKDKAFADANHATYPGPWTRQTDDLIEQAKHQLLDVE